jgi:threonyl-tRNA synthetase
MERFTGVLIEHCAGKFPLWLSPEQFAILPVSDKFVEYSYQVKQALEAEDLRGFVDDRNETIGRKIRDNELKRIPFLLIVGEKEVEGGTVSVRKQGGEGDQGAVSVSAFANMVKELL